MMLTISIIGWLAAASLLLGYRLVTTGRVQGESLTYLGLNMFGSLGLGLSTAATHSWPSAANNLIWLLMGIGPLVRAVALFRRRRATQPTLPSTPSQHVPV